MTVQAITLNGVTFYATNVARTTTVIGTGINAASGARRFARRAVKHGWDITIEDTTDTVRAALETIANLTTTFTFVDQHGASATVFCKDDALSDEISDIATESGAQVLYYNLTLHVTEA